MVIQHHYNIKNIIFLFCIFFNRSAYAMDMQKDLKDSLFSFFASPTLSDKEHVALNSVCQDFQSDYIQHWWYKNESYHHEKDINSLSVNSPGTELAIGSEGSIQILDLSTGLKDTVLKDALSTNNFVCFDRSGNQLATTLSSRNVYVIDKKTKEKKRVFSQRNLDIFICFDSASKNLAISNKKDIFLINMNSQKTHHIPNYENLKNYIYFNANEDLIMLLLKKKTLHLLNIMTGQEIAWFNCDGLISSLYCNIDKNIIAIEKLKTICIVDITTKKHVATFNCDDQNFFAGMSCSYEGTCLAANTVNNDIYIFKCLKKQSLNQLMIKKIIQLWLQVKKPDRKITTVHFLFKNIEELFRINYQVLKDTWITFPKSMRISIWQTLYKKIRYYSAPPQRFVSF